MLLFTSPVLSLSFREYLLIYVPKVKKEVQGL